MIMTTKKESENVPIANRPLIRFLILIAVVVVIGVTYFGYSYIQKRNRCSDLIVYHPATQSVSSSNSFISKQGVGEYYSYTYRTGSYFETSKFKTRDAAISACTASK
ncbi:MAG TPA: hypothetical protein ENI76_06130 [Ignavibacteria bacterium]|nr:hypothetical protein [Ignavibacteria bacterium]